MRRRRPAFLVLVAVGSLGAAGCRSDPAPPAVSQPVSAQAALPGQAGSQTAQAGDLVCVSYCSATEPGTPVTEIKWVVATQPASAENLRRAASQQNIEAAVNEDGFERGRFVRLSSVAPQARFAPSATQPTASQLPGLADLTVAAVGGSQEAASALRLATPPEGGQENIVLQVQGLRPGMNYYWRVRAGTAGDTQIVMCRAPICPADRRGR